MVTSAAPIAVRARWTRACIVGELVGFVPPALTGGLLVTFGAPEVVLVVALVIAGMGEGFILGVAQSAVLRDVLPGVSGWVAATTLAAGAAWLAGMGGSSLVQVVDRSERVARGRSRSRRRRRSGRNGRDRRPDHGVDPCRFRPGLFRPGTRGVHPPGPSSQSSSLEAKSDGVVDLRNSWNSLTTLSISSSLSAVADACSTRTAASSKTLVHT